MKAIFHPEAHEEMTESARFYERRSEGFGSDFLTAVEQTTRRIEHFLKQVQSIKQTYASAWCQAFLLRFFTRFNLIESSSPPLCINIAGLVTGETRLQSISYFETNGQSSL